MLYLLLSGQPFNKVDPPPASSTSPQGVTVTATPCSLSRPASSPKAPSPAASPPDPSRRCHRASDLHLVAGRARGPAPVLPSIGVGRRPSRRTRWPCNSATVDRSSGWNRSRRAPSLDGGRTRAGRRVRRPAGQGMPARYMAGAGRCAGPQSTTVGRSGSRTVASTSARCRSFVRAAESGGRSSKRKKSTASVSSLERALPPTMSHRNTSL